jgi:hypothetical protein
MGLMDTVKGWFGGNKDTVKGGVDKTGDAVDDKTGGKYAEPVDKGQDAATDAVDKIADDPTTSN